MKGSEAQRFRGVLGLIAQEAGIIKAKRKPMARRSDRRFPENRKRSEG